MAEMIAKVCYARLQILLLLPRQLSGGSLLQFPQDPLSRTMLVFEIMALFVKPLLALSFWRTFSLPARQQDSFPRDTSRG